MRAISIVLVLIILLFGFDPPKERNLKICEMSIFESLKKNDK